MTLSKNATRPPVHMIEAEADAIADLALATTDRNPEVSALLLQEIDRATICGTSAIPADAITMHSEVEFIDESRGTPYRLQLVWPGEADFSAGRISILAPTGAGLIGLRQGSSILWPDREGRERCLTITKVSQPER